MPSNPPAGLEGGAIMLNTSAPGCSSRACLLNITSTSFIHNTAAMIGGAVSVLTQGLHVVLDHSTFMQNSAQLACGAFCFQSSTGSSQQLTMSGNRTNFVSNSAEQSGGVQANASDVQLLGCMFLNNSATDSNGGELSLREVQSRVLDDCTLQTTQVSKCKFVYND